MPFLNPWYFLLSIFIATVILFYFFRKQYEERSISSNLLWEQVLNEWQASPWLKKLQQNLLFWLQIIALLLLMFALLRPFWLEEQVQGEHLIFILDSSASMSAQFEETTRFEAAKEELLEYIDRLNGQEVTLIHAGKNPEILLSQEEDLALIREKINDIEMSYESEEMEQAVNLAASLASGTDAVIHLFSDSMHKEELAEAAGEQYIEVHNIGKKLNNLSLASFGVAQIENEISGVAVIKNQGDTEQVFSFEVISGNEKLFEKEVTLTEHEERVLPIDSLPEMPYYEAMIHVEDGYAADNTFTSIYTESNPGIYGAGEINPFVIKGFETIGANVLQSHHVNSMEEENGILLLESSSLNDLPERPLILFNSGDEKFELTEPIQAEKDPLWQYVDVDKIYIAAARKEFAGDWETILKSGQVPLIQKGSINGQPLLIFNFSLSDSDWPLHPGFPIFLYNSYQWLAKQSSFLGYFQPGEEKWLNVKEDRANWEIFNGQDEHLYTLHLNEESFKAPYKPGTYQVVSGDSIQYFSVLLDDQEKSAEIQPSFTLNERQAPVEAKTQGRNDQLWFWFAIIALILIFIEWEVYRRGYRS